MQRRREDLCIRFFVAVSNERKIPGLANDLRQVRTAEECFSLLLSLVKREQSINATGFCNMSCDLRLSICRELKAHAPKLFARLKELADTKNSACDQHRRDHDGANDGYDYNGPSFNSILAIEAAVATVIKISQKEAAPKSR